MELRALLQVTLLRLQTETVIYLLDLRPSLYSAALWLLKAAGPALEVLLLLLICIVADKEPPPPPPVPVVLISLRRMETEDVLDENNTVCERDGLGLIE